MPKLAIAGTLYEVDDKGFLQETEKWTEDVARGYAALEGVAELTQDHWVAIRYLRGYYLENGICPMIRRLTKETGLGLKRLYELFPQGPANSACKWAGVPKPTGCV
jgi:tRNA 2-thiouridine synthesizing protein E